MHLGRGINSKASIAHPNMAHRDRRLNIGARKGNPRHKVDRSLIDKEETSRSKNLTLLIRTHVWPCGPVIIRLHIPMVLGQMDFS